MGSGWLSPKLWQATLAMLQDADLKSGTRKLAQLACDLQVLKPWRQRAGRMHFHCSHWTTPAMGSKPRQTRHANSDPVPPCHLTLMQILQVALERVSHLHTREDSKALRNAAFTLSKVPRLRGGLLTGKGTQPPSPSGFCPFPQNSA